MKFIKGSMVVFVLNVVLIKIINGTVHDLDSEVRHPPFDQNIYENVLDPKLCAEQMKYLTTNDTMLMVTCKYF